MWVTYQGVPALVTFIGERDAVFWSDRDPVERRNTVLANLASLFGTQAASPVCYVEKDWLKVWPES